MAWRWRNRVFTWYAAMDSPVRFSRIVGMFGITTVIACLAVAATWALRAGPLSGANSIVALIARSILFAVFYLASAMLFKETRDLVRESARTLPTTLRSVFSNKE